MSNGRSSWSYGTPKHEQMRTILIIDDDDAVRGVIRELLRVRGYGVIEAPDGRAGVAAAIAAPPDLIICDIVMPHFDGYATVKALRENESTVAIPIILLTGQSGQAAMRQGMDLGADDFIGKPFKPDDLYNAIQSRFDRLEMQQKKSENKLTELRGRLNHVLPHELRTPLQSILGFADILADEHDTMPRAEIGKTAKLILNAARRLNRLTENFLLSSQIEIIANDPATLATLREQVVENPAGLVCDQAEIMAREARRDDDFVTEMESIPVCITRENLHKIVQELFSNCLKFSSPGQAIAVVSYADGTHLIIQFYNQGRGMTPNQIQNIGAYNQFGRNEHEQQGAGLGLHLAKRLVELHGGRLEIESVPNQETTVRILLRKA
jgi:two-component system, sensor histidine kinase and response regulator